MFRSAGGNWCENDVGCISYSITMKEARHNVLALAYRLLHIVLTHESHTAKPARALLFVIAMQQ
eukprot:6193980-Pleurochrysis_carterae.AAC.2